MPYEVLKDETKRKAAWARRARAKVEMIGDSLQLTVYDEDGHTRISLTCFKAASDMRDALRDCATALGEMVIDLYPDGDAKAAIDKARAALAKADGTMANGKMDMAIKATFERMTALAKADGKKA